MRLIDADELMKHAGNCYDEQGHLLYAVGTGNIMAAKTIDPVRHGKWMAIYNTGLAACECGYITDRYSIYNYCPNCGAKMDGGEE